MRENSFVSKLPGGVGVEGNRMVGMPEKLLRNHRRHSLVIMMRGAAHYHNGFSEFSVK